LGAEVKIRVPSTPWRYASALLFAIPLLVAVGTFALIGVVDGGGRIEPLLIVALIPRLLFMYFWLWVAGQYISQEQVFALDGSHALVRVRGLVGPARTTRVDLSRRNARGFEVERFRGDDAGHYRPSFRPRVVLRTADGYPFVSLGPALTLEEAQAVCDALNALFGSSIAGQEEGLAGTSNKRIEQNARR